MKKEVITFGTDGWRAVIDKEFTEDNVNRVAVATADYFLRTNQKKCVIGYDNRRKSEDFAKITAIVFKQKGLAVDLSSTPCPTPAVSYMTMDFYDFGIMITASHNPSEYNGFKVKVASGAPAPPEVTKEIETLLPDTPLAFTDVDVPTINIEEKYLAKVDTLVDWDVITSITSQVVIDTMHGSGGGFLLHLLEKHGVAAREIHGERDVSFGGVNPEPLEKNVQDIMKELKKNPGEFQIGLLLDGDADRMGAVDGEGNYLNSQKIFSLLLYHLIKNKKMTGMVVRAFNNTQRLAKMCEKYNVHLETVPIGFKHVARIIAREDVLLGGEESGGYAIKGYIPDRDGQYCNLLLLELMAYEKKPIADILHDLEKEFGTYYFNRIDKHIPEDKKKALLDFLGSITPEDCKFFSESVMSIETLDGYKFKFNDDEWVLCRASGTEPIIRIYADTLLSEKTEKVLKEFVKFVDDGSY
ncbi:phosphoglucomutase/phosphomannomutase family protein [Candidatus Margulisiibacteriota bacterium]